MVEFVTFVLEFMQLRLTFPANWNKKVLRMVYQPCKVAR